MDDSVESQVRKIKEECDIINPLVTVRCLAYNQINYIRDCLDGFVMQQTSFPFIAIIHDDASTDGTAEIIKEYAEKYPDIIKPIFEYENQYSKKDGSLGRVVNDATKIIGAKYLALCEGDDYWTDPLKLQKQVDFMEANPDYSMISTNYDILNLKTNKLRSCLDDIETDVSMENIIMESWRYCRTLTLLLRSDLYNEKGKYIAGLYVGDYPLCVYMRKHGKVRLLGKDHCAVYRYLSVGSWTSKDSENRKSLKDIRRVGEKEMQMIDVLDTMTEGKWHSVFKKRKLQYWFNRYLNNFPSQAAMIFLKNPKFFLSEYPKRTIIMQFGYLQLKKFFN